jgi:predicted phosphoribosyltransferase
MVYRLLLGITELVCYPLFRWLRARQPYVSKEQHPTIAVVCATIATGKSLAAALPTWQANKPTEIWIFTNELMHAFNKEWLAEVRDSNVNIQS